MDGKGFRGWSCSDNVKHDSVHVSEYHMQKMLRARSLINCGFICAASMLARIKLMVNPAITKLPFSMLHAIKFLVGFTCDCMYCILAYEI